MTDRWITPNAEQRTHAELVQQDIIELLNRLIREGIDPRVILAGIASASCDMLTNVFGQSSVVPWFEMQAKIARDLTKPN